MNKEKAATLLDRCLEWLLYLLILLIPVSKAAIEIIFTMAMFVFAAKKILEPDFRFLKNRTHIFLFLFFGFCALSLANSGIYFVKGLKALFGKWLEYILLFIMAEDTLTTAPRRRNAALVLLATLALLGADALFQRFNGIDFLRQRPLLDGSRPTASFENQNGFAAYLVPGLVLSITLLFSSAVKKAYKAYLAFILLMAAAALIMTFSRSAWVGFFSGLVFWIFISRNFKQAAIPICLLVIVLLSIAPVRQRAISIFERGGDSDRLAMINTTFGMIKDNPVLGKGLGTYMDYFQKYSTIEGVYYAHNSYLQVWAEAGVFAFFSLLIFLGAVFYRGIKLFRKHGDYALLGIISGLGGFLVGALFDNHLYSMQLAAFFWFSLGLVIR